MSTESDYRIEAEDIMEEVAETFGEILEQSKTRSGVGFDDILLQSVIKLAIQVATLRRSYEVLSKAMADSIGERFAGSEVGHNLILQKLQENNMNTNQSLYTMNEKISAIESSVNSIEYRLGRL